MKRGLFKGIRVWHLGMAFFWASSMLCHRSTLLLPDGPEVEMLEMAILLSSFSVNIITMLTVSAWLRSRPQDLVRVPALPFVAAASVGVACYGLTSLFDADYRLFIVLLGGVLTGLGFGFLWGSWAESYGRMHPTRNALLMVLVFILTVALYLFITVAQELLGQPAVFFMVLLPPLSYACLMRCRRENRSISYFSSNRAYLQALGSLWQLLLGTVVLSFLFGSIWQLAVIYAGSVNEAHRIPLVVNLLCGVAILVVILLTKRQLNLDFVYRFIGPLIVGACLLIPFFLQSTPLVFQTVMSTGYGVFDIVIWYMVAESSFDHRVSGFVVGSIVRSVALVARLAGFLAGAMFALLPPGSYYINIVLFALFVGTSYLLVIWLFAYRRHVRRRAFLRQMMPRVRALPVGAPEDEMIDLVVDAVQGNHALVAGITDDAPRPDDELERIIEERCRMLSSTYGLSRRESEVLPYLVRGRSAGYVADVLFVSENTVRSHIRRIMEKTGVHSKQDLIDIADLMSIQETGKDADGQRATQHNNTTGAGE
ncbi:MAG: LuxR C-terminal-related transcriptional regulator [Coriobacteriales bacterium]|nr:LuxR C-terminal-related transcriptional regulator [Coriobacteriales bacterium]